MKAEWELPLLAFPLRVVLDSGDIVGVAVQSTDFLAEVKSALRNKGKETQQGMYFYLESGVLSEE